MTVRTYEIADAIMDSAASEYRAFNLANAKAVENYAFNGMDIVISEAEATAILTACRSYISCTEGGEFDGQGQLAWDERVRRPLEDWGIYEIQDCHDGNWETITEGEFHDFDMAVSALRELEFNLGWRGLRIVETSGEYPDVVLEGEPKPESDE